MVNTSGDRYQIKAASSGKCIEPIGGAMANGTGIQQATCRVLPRQEWKLRAKGSNGQFEIFHPRSNRCLSIRGGNTATQEGAYAELRDCNGQSYQRWRKESPIIASDWTVRELPTQVESTGTYISSFYWDVNDNGDTVASYITAAGHGNSTDGAALVHADGSISDFRSFSWESASPRAINNSAAFAGIEKVDAYVLPYDQRGKPHAFIYSNGNAVEIPLPTMPGVDPKSIFTYAADLNNSGVVAGHSAIRNPDGVTMQTRAFLYGNGTLTDLSVPSGATSTRALAVNDANMAVGEADYADGTIKPFIYRNGASSTLALPASHNSGSAADVNSSGQIAGDLFNNAGGEKTNWRPFIYTDGIMRKIDMPYSDGWGVTSGINARGQVVGTLYATNAQGETGSFGVFLHGGGKTIDLNNLPQFQTDGIQFREAIATSSSGRILVRGLEGTTWKYYVLSPMR